MARDESVIFFGEDVAAAGGVFMATRSARAPTGEERVFDTISSWPSREPRSGRVTGLRPVFEIMFGDFMGLPMDSLANQAAKFWYVSNEQEGAAGGGAGGGRRRFGAIHSQFRHLVPGNTGPL